MDRQLAAQAPLDSRGRRSLVRADLSQLLTLSGPVVLSRLGIMAMGLCDAIVVGNYSARQLGYHALAWAPTSVILTMAVGLLTGVQVMTARDRPARFTSVSVIARSPRFRPRRPPWPPPFTASTGFTRPQP